MVDRPRAARRLEATDAPHREYLPTRGVVVFSEVKCQFEDSVTVSCFPPLASAAAVPASPVFAEHDSNAQSSVQPCVTVAAAACIARLHWTSRLQPSTTSIPSHRAGFTILPTSSWPVPVVIS